MSKTFGDVQELKRNWEADPCWDLEDTEGFEEWRDELLNYRLLKQAEWKAESKEQAEQEARRQRAFGRTPVGVSGGVMPVVVCRDGSVWQLVSRPVDDSVDGQRLQTWEQLPAIPGSVSDVRQDYWLEGGDK